MISTVRGTRDILPSDVGRWQRLETVARRICRQYGYQEIRTPILEREELFAKGTGEATDIVQKEMYTFVDKSGDRVTLRPEATPSMVRAFVQHSLEQSMPVAKLYSLGPMFRYEKPQKGRQRQFHQLGVEAFGLHGPDIDAEQIMICDRMWRQLKIKNINLQINSLGASESRLNYRNIFDSLKLKPENITSRDYYPQENVCINAVACNDKLLNDVFKADI